MESNSRPIVWHPKGVSDTLESTTAFQGAMASLSNLIPDPTTAQLWQCRPAAFKLVDFTTGAHAPVNPGTISCYKIVGNTIYGLISNTVSGIDRPFAYNLLSKSFIPITVAIPIFPVALGATLATPPQMDVVGPNVLFAHQGFGSTTAFFGVLNISNPAVPVWSAGNLTGAIQFTQVPTSVAQFDGRAYWMVNNIQQPALVFSDILNPTNCFAATQVLTFGDVAFLTALGQLRLFNQLGGIIQSLIVFKGSQNTYQITGDAALGNLAINAMNFATGTLAPNTVISTPKGLSFMAPDGIRTIDFYGNISDPIGMDGQGVAVPFIYATNPITACGACNGNVMRFTVNNGSFGLDNLNQDWWYDIERKIWHGPHTFPAALIQPYQGTFIMAGLGINAALWQSDPVQQPGSMFVENGVQMTWQYYTSLLPDLEEMSGYAIHQSLLDVAFISTIPNPVVNAVDQDGFVLDTVNIPPSGGGPTWGEFNWGTVNWGSAGGFALVARQLAWHAPIVFNRIQFQVTGQCDKSLKLGAIRLRYKQLKYLTNIFAVGGINAKNFGINFGKDFGPSFGG